MQKDIGIYGDRVDRKRLDATTDEDAVPGMYPTPTTIRHALGISQKDTNFHMAESSFRVVFSMQFHS
ncbi:helix-turn-helix DUF1870 domain-containing protein (plasmid) [Zymomonas mobilis subsp. mobilis ZM4 = ATCC 31821]|uniref:Uncharacterized protein n=1 Tax=Zymomonas mobilis subsp. mobilis (strain ATCC 31821 / ZM4 / CP4) TaxID=264203 RepID=Q8GF38_ZYMMO|nr:hypothetical protein [Zymomonas mobilis]AAL36130.1 unknown [Zymomonas mobilis subsp. mobilis ZM4 = ATCC 31821]AVZ26926.1 helix-turn-helix DUF1870 domain-containing protein [Zymomonas mobilis subsp. mobilis]AVZ28765.1 helix-turn-helix DUF1870 domain-containing protein [Zymomonas mobilis subsp. mobilis]AVZ43258.1 helix-turn-helix DUF1870 domain-containing protein [Zymomonas mobilis subsp. mobilis ZM4 = ATCC 31821]